VGNGKAHGTPIEGIRRIDDTDQNLLVSMEDAKVFKNPMVGEEGMFCE
jgi:hypothetical protein